MKRAVRIQLLQVGQVLLECFIRVAQQSANEDCNVAIWLVSMRSGMEYG